MLPCGLLFLFSGPTEKEDICCVGQEWKTHTFLSLICFFIHKLPLGEEWLPASDLLKHSLGQHQLLRDFLWAKFLILSVIEHLAVDL